MCDFNFLVLAIRPLKYPGASVITIGMKCLSICKHSATLNYACLMLCWIAVIRSQCYLITHCLINQQCACCNLPNLHYPINFYALSSFLPGFSSFCLLTPFMWVFSVWTCSLFLTCFFDVRFVRVVRWQPAAATRSSPLWRRSQGRRAQTARSPLPLPAAPPPQGLTLTLLLTRYCKSHPDVLQNSPASPDLAAHLTTTNPLQSPV